jgi:hypothetical protein
MLFVTEHANQFRSQGFIQQADDCLAIGSIALRDGPFFDVLARAAPDFLDVRNEFTGLCFGNGILHVIHSSLNYFEEMLKEFSALCHWFRGQGSLASCLTKAFAAITGTAEKGIDKGHGIWPTSPNHG